MNRLSRERGPELKAGALIAVLGSVFVFLMISAFADGEVRRSEMPLRALLGSRAYEALVAGEEAPQHYLQRPPSPVWASWLSPGSDGQDPSDDRLAPDFSLPARDGSTWRLSDHRGKVIILNFWSVTCPPCVEEMPSLMELGRILAHSDDVELVTISADSDWETVRTVIPDGAPMTVLLDPERAVIREKFGTRLYPETWVIDPEGIIRLRVDGSRDWSSPVVLDMIQGYL